jgi:hypothetical protein
MISNWSPSGTLSDGATVDGILKVKVVCRGSPAWFRFQYDFKLATMWKSIQRASMWYLYCRVLTKNEVTASQNASTNAQSSRYLVNPRVSQIKTWRSYRDRWTPHTGVICSKIKTAFFEQSLIQSCIWLPFHFHFQNRKILSTTWKGIERAPTRYIFCALSFKTCWVMDL